jgi:hypothetical protein
MKRISFGMLLPYVLLANLAIAGCGGDQMRDGSASDGVLTRPMLTLEECGDLRGEPLGIPGAPPRLGDPGIDLSRDDECPGSRTVKGTLETTSDSNGGLCCEVPASVSVEECTNADGRVLADPGGGSSYVAGCAAGETLVGWLASTCEEPPCHTTGVCCH